MQSLREMRYSGLKKSSQDDLMYIKRYVPGSNNLTDRKAFHCEKAPHGTVLAV
jgi:hypothetical protein